MSEKTATFPLQVQKLAFKVENYNCNQKIQKRNAQQNIRMALKSCIYTKLAAMKFQNFWFHISNKKKRTAGKKI